jgi:nicotinic acid phosphoribosyltransferase
LRPNLTGDLTVEKVTQIVEEFPEVVGFGIGTKLSSEVKHVAGVIFKACLIGGRPTLKASNSIDKTTLPGQLQVFRGVDAKGNYVAGRDGDWLMKTFKYRAPRTLSDWSSRFGKMVSIQRFLRSKNRKRSWAEQIIRFGDLHNYPLTLSERLTKLRDNLTEQMRADNSGWEKILKLPEEMAEELINSK